MKSFIVSIALILLFNIYTVFQIDSDTYRRQLERLKFVAEECADSAALYYDLEAYSQGKIIYNQDEGIKAIEYMLKTHLKLDDSLKPVSGYWQDQIQYDVYFIDEKNYTFPYEFPYEFIDARTGYKMYIFEPTVIVTIEAGRGRMRLPFLSINSSIRSSAYEYLN